jgi:hypothetical protein
VFGLQRLGALRENIEQLNQQLKARHAQIMTHVTEATRYAGFGE